MKGKTRNKQVEVPMKFNNAMMGYEPDLNKIKKGIRKARRREK